MSFNTWMPFYWADYFAHTSHLNAAEHGAYLMLIGHLWTTKKPIANDDTILARIARCSIQEWQSIRIQIEPMFEVSEKCWNSKRVKNELKRAQNLHEKRVEAGKKRQSKNKDLSAHAEHTTQPGYTQPQSQPQSQEDSSKTLVVADAPPPARAAPKSRLPETWTPTQKDIAYARQQNLNDADIAREARNFLRYWTGPDCKNSRKSDWHRTWCNRIDDIAGRVVANRNLARQTNGNRNGRGGIVSALSQLLVEEDGPLDGDDPLFKQRSTPGNSSPGFEDFGGVGGIVIDADVSKPHTEAIGRVEIHHAAKGRG
jgi:uncharacterized protein YdaU (DUF1376 family)